LSSDQPIEVTAWPLQLPCEAETVKGEVTEAPLSGADTLGPVELPDELAAAVLTVTGTSATQEAPDAPHDLTWMVWPPFASERLVLMAEPLTTVVDVEPSMEYPIVAIDWLEHADALADSVKGDETVLPIAGLLTVTPAKAGTANAVRKSAAAESLLKSFIYQGPSD
jgi:hypothetical protein